MIDDGLGAEPTSRDTVFALLFLDDGRTETHGIYTSMERAKRAYVSLATSGLLDGRGGAYSVEEYPLDQPLMGTVVVDGAELLALLAAEAELVLDVLPEE
jgi:hypothetical protein